MTAKKTTTKEPISKEKTAPAKKAAVKKSTATKTEKTTMATAEKKAPKKATRKVGARGKSLKKPAPPKERRFEHVLNLFGGKDKSEFSTEEKLKSLFQIQLIETEIDKIRVVRGELPMEVNDLEDEIAGLETRIQKLTDEADAVNETIAQKKQLIKDAKDGLKKYDEQQMEVKNNREYESLNKEIEYLQLETQLAEKRIKEFTADVAAKNEILEASQELLKERNEDLKNKQSELETIIAETKKEEEQLLKFSKDASKIIDDRLFVAYKRIRENARNGLAVVTVQRDACGGCFNKIPPQRQIDIKQHKKVIVCEHCGRILVDHEIKI
jgi:uncharacterized protein